MLLKEVEGQSPPSELVSEAHTVESDTFPMATIQVRVYVAILSHGIYTTF